MQSRVYRLRPISSIITVTGKKNHRGTYCFEEETEMKA